MPHKAGNVGVCNSQSLCVFAEKAAALQQMGKESPGLIAVGQSPDILPVDQVRGKIVKEQVRPLQTQGKSTVVLF